MRYAIFSEIYGNRQAWNAIVDDFTSLGVDMPICLGDVSGHGAGTAEILEDLRSRTGNIVLGDCDAALVGLLGEAHPDEGTNHCIRWTREHLHQGALSYLAERPLALETGGILFVHGECVEPGRYRGIGSESAARENLEATTHRVTFLGHAREPGIYRQQANGVIDSLPAENRELSSDCRYLVNVGSVGEPATVEDPAACYVIYDNETQELTFRRVAFDVAAYRADILDAGLFLRPWCTDGDQRDTTGTPLAGSLSPEHREEGAVVALASVETVVEPLFQPSVNPPARRSRGVLAWMALVSVVVLAAGVGVFVFKEIRERQEVQFPLGGSETASAGRAVPQSDPEGNLQPLVLPQTGIEVAKQPVESGDLPDLDSEPVIDGPGRSPEGVAENDPSDTPVPPASELTDEPKSTDLPEPAGESEPEDSLEQGVAETALPEGKAPIPPEPADVASLRPPTRSLIYYAPFDEDSTEFRIRDLSGGERDLDATSGSPGILGRIGMACRLVEENGSEAMRSPVKPLSEVEDVTIAFWLKRPDTALQTPPESGAPAGIKKLTDATLLSFDSVGEVRVVNDRIEAVVGEGAPATLGFPQDLLWHHILVERVNGETSIWLDHRVQSKVVPSVAGPSAAEEAAVQVGSKNADFCIDEAAIWARGFTAEERCVLYRLGRFDTPIMAPPSSIAYWGFDKSKLGKGVFGDYIGTRPLGSYARWKPAKPLAPDPVPMTTKRNVVAAQVSHLAESKEGAGSFEMKGDTPFTYEGWFKPGRLTAGTLGGTVATTNDKGEAGWRLALSPGKSGKGFLAFIYDTGSEKMQAVAENVPIYDGLPHHLAAVWNPRSSETHGSMGIFLDNKLVASALLPLEKLRPASGQHFRIAVGGSAVVVDELRFTTGSLRPSEFLTKGEARPAPELPIAGNNERRIAPASRPGETPFQRAARELQERKAEQAAERERKRAEDDRRRREGFGVRD